jgi:hypothetical protein
MSSSFLKKAPLLFATLLLSACEPQTLTQFVRAFQKEFKTTIRLEGTAASSDPALTACTTAQLRIWLSDYKALPRAERKKAREKFANYKTWTLQSEVATEVLSGETVSLSASYESCGYEYRCEKVCARPGRDDRPRDPFGRPDPFESCPIGSEYESCSRVHQCRTQHIGDKTLRSDIQAEGALPQNQLRFDNAQLTLLPEITENRVVSRSAHTESAGLFTQIESVADFEKAVAEKQLSEVVDGSVTRECGVMLPFQALLDSKVATAYREEIIRVLKVLQKTESPRPSVHAYRADRGSLLKELAAGYSDKGYPSFDAAQVDSLLSRIAPGQYNWHSSHWSQPRLLAAAIAMSR